MTPRHEYFEQSSPIEAIVDCRGMLKHEVKGNELCWFGNFEYIVKDLQDPKKKLLQNYVYREKKYGKTNVGERAAKTCLSDFCELVGIERDGINNMWARQTFVQTGLKDLQLPAQQIMEVSGHRSEIQMRKDYRTEPDLCSNFPSETTYREKQQCLVVNNILHSLFPALKRFT